MPMMPILYISKNLYRKTNIRMPAELFICGSTEEGQCYE